MKKTITTFALFASMCFMASSCQKEEVLPTRSPSVETESSASFAMRYYIDGVSNTVVLHGDKERTNFIHWMLVLAKEGRKVVFNNLLQTENNLSTKETVTFSTTDQHAAEAWADKMIGGGYSVRIEYDKEKQVYNCIAFR